MKILCLVLIVLCSVTIQSPISTQLFNLNLIGEPFSVNFLSDTEIMTSSTKGLVAKVDLKTGNVKYLKNMLYSMKFNMQSEGICNLKINLDSILINEEKNFIDLYNNEKNQLIWSLNYAQRRSPYRTYTILKYFLSKFKENIIGIFLENGCLKIFNDERILAENEALTSEEFIDVIYEKNNNLIYDVKYDAHNDTVKITANKLADIYEYNKFKTKSDYEIKLKGKVLKSYSTKGYIVLQTGKNHFTYISLINGLSFFSEFKDQILDVYEFFNANKIVLMTKTNLITIDLTKTNDGEFQLKTAKLEESSVNIKLDSRKYQSLLFFASKGETFVISEFELSINKIESAIEIPLKYSCKIKNVFSTFIDESFKPYSLVVCEDLKVLMIDVIAKKLLWTQDAGLTNVAFSKIISYNVELDQSAEYTSMHFHKLEDFAYKIQITTLVSNIVSSIYNDLIDLSKSFVSQMQVLIKQEINKPSMTINSDNTYVLVLFTEKNELMIFNCLNGDLKYKQRFLNKILLDVSHHSIHNSPVLKLKFEDLNSNKISLVVLNLITNRVISEESYENTTKLVNNINVTELSSENSQIEFLVGNGNEQVIEREILIKREGNSYYGVKVNRVSHEKLLLSQVWSLNLESSSIIDFKLSNIHEHTTTTYLTGGKILYKFLDNNLGVVVYTHDRRTLLFSVINSYNGKILYQASITNVDFTQRINTVFEENIVLVSYIKKDKNINRNEVFIVEIMKREIEHSFINLIEKVLQFDSKTENSSNLDETDLIFQEACYIIPKRVKHIYTSETKLNISNKQIIFVLENNLVYFLDRRFAGGRRPLAKDDKKGSPPMIDPAMNSIYVDLESPPYSPLLMIDYKNILNENFIDDNIDKIVVSPTEYESSFILCTTGGNIACYKVYPDKNYDSLHLVFGFNIIGLFLLGLITITYILRKYVKNLEYKNAFLNS